MISITITLLPNFDKDADGSVHKFSFAASHTIRLYVRAHTEVGDRSTAAHSALISHLPTAADFRRHGRGRLIGGDGSIFAGDKSIRRYAAYLCSASISAESDISRGGASRARLAQEARDG